MQAWPPKLRAMNNTDIQQLEDFLASPERPEGTLRFHELQGFLFAVACSPETIPPSEWLPLIGNDEPLNFAYENEAQKILGLMMNLYNETNAAVLERSNSLPAGCVFDEDISKNFEDDSSISQWSSGFASGHDWLAELWEGYLVDELDEECGATLMVLSFFSSRQLAEAYFREMKPGSAKKGDASFEDFANKMLLTGNRPKVTRSGAMNPAPAVVARSTKDVAVRLFTDPGRVS